MPSLRHFVLQQRALELYRAAIRASRCIPDPHTRAETLRWFRTEIQRNSHLTDTVALETHLNTVSREISQLFPAARRVT